MGRCPALTFKLLSPWPCIHAAEIGLTCLHVVLWQVMLRGDATARHGCPSRDLRSSCQVALGGTCSQVMPSVSGGLQLCELVVAPPLVWMVSQSASPILPEACLDRKPHGNAQLLSGVPSWVRQSHRPNHEIAHKHNDSPELLSALFSRVVLRGAVSSCTSSKIRQQCQGTA